MVKFNDSTSSDDFGNAAQPYPDREVVYSANNKTGVCYVEVRHRGVTSNLTLHNNIALYVSERFEIAKIGLRGSYNRPPLQMSPILAHERRKGSELAHVGHEGFTNAEFIVYFESVLRDWGRENGYEVNEGEPLIRPETKPGPYKYSPLVAIPPEELNA